MFRLDYGPVPGWLNGRIESMGLPSPFGHPVIHGYAAGGMGE
jgi:hypothetical protein